jgi:hypothetical protein
LGTVFGFDSGSVFGKIFFFLGCFSTGTFGVSSESERSRSLDFFGNCLRLTVGAEKRELRHFGPMID